MAFTIVLRGPTAGGKSEIAKRITKEMPNFVHIDIDKIKYEISGSPHWKNPFEAAWWFSRANNLAHKHLRNGKDVILDEAFSDYFIFRITIDGLDSYGKILVVEICYQEEVHVRRYASKDESIRIHGEDSASIVKSFYPEYKNGLFRENSKIEEIKNDLSFKDPTKNIDEIVQEIVNKVKDEMRT